MLQIPQQFSASSSQEMLSPNDGQLLRSASGSIHSVDIEVEPPGTNDWGNPFTSAAGSPWGGSLPAATTLGPQQASGFGAPRTSTPCAAYESMSTPPGFTCPLPPGRTPSKPPHSYPLLASSGKSGGTSYSSTSSSSTSSSGSGSRLHRSRQSAGSTIIQNFVPPPSVSLVGRAVVSPGASPPDPTGDDVYEHPCEFCDGYSADGYGQGCVLAAGWRTVSVYGFSVILSFVT
ncbi:hypothetical protein ARMGADRAFT_1137519 [Armillaria gallica]|uniref:Uncharacterized protein n=1 Tax=Armillaria gallica TaxID=47427 RepID=A0A2H3CV85_ARMGA|nr:hypothetical protein ARMGADRAFT_1137519 [Armillaria gallica]